MCGCRISSQYFIVELLTGLLLMFAFFNSTSVLSFLYISIILCIFIVIGIYDIKHTIVPDKLSYTAATLAFAGLFVDLSTYTISTPDYTAIMAGPIIATPLFLFWFFSHGKWMGLGDAKLALSIGWLLGLSGAISGILIAFWAGALFGIILILYTKVQNAMSGKVGWKNKLLPRTRQRTIKSEIPFAPFLLLGFVAVMFFKADVLYILALNI